MKIQSSLIVLLFTSLQLTFAQKQEELKYPKTEKKVVEDEYFGTKVEDPYQWLEDDRSKETEAWVKAQNEVTFNYLNGIPEKKAIAERYSELYNYTKVFSPLKVGEYYFIYRQDGLQNQPVIYYKLGSMGEEKVFIDPNQLSEDGTTSVDLLGYSKDKKYIAYSMSVAGSDWKKIKVREIATNNELPDELDWVKFSGAAWAGDGFYYSRYPAPEAGKELSGANSFHAVYYHKLGDPQEQDEYVFGNKENPKLYHWANTTRNEQYVIVYAATGTDGYEMYYKNLEDDHGHFHAFVRGYKYKTDVIDFIDGRFIMKTNYNAPKYRLFSVDPNFPARTDWLDLVPEGDHLLKDATTGGGYIFATYLEDAATKVYRFNRDGSNKTEVKLPGLGSATGFSGDLDETRLFYSYSSFTYPSTIFEYDVTSGNSDVFYRPEVKFNPDDYEVNQKFYTSKDGTKVPMFIVHKKGLELNQQNPTLLYGYGGFNVSLGPRFSTSNIIFLENGGVYAVANLRGGGEYGEDWHKAGMLMDKQNVFDDFIAAADFLISEGYTREQKLAVAGGSNGGLLVGALMTQRPNLAKVALPAVGVMDMLRFHKFTVGWGWVPEYGSSEQSAEMFEYLYGYSPYHNLKEGISYPATMVTTADHDDRVVPAHSFKFAARLQEYHSGVNPVIIRIETDAGHGAGKPTSKIIEEQADKWAFVFRNLNHKVIYNK